LTSPAAGYTIIAALCLADGLFVVGGGSENAGVFLEIGSAGYFDQQQGLRRACTPFFALPS